MTKIEWTRGDDGTPGETWNPTTGCDRISPGCDNCYALTMAKRLKAMEHARGTAHPKYQTDGDPRTSGPGFGLAVHPDVLTEPLRWKKPRRVFVNSMSDLFHARVPREFLARVFAVMAATPQHTYQILTKRPERAARILTDLCTCGRGHPPGEHFRSEMEWAATSHSPTYVPGLEHGIYHRSGWPLPNVWIGTSVENQKYADLRIPALLETPAAVRFLSCEPLLGPVDLTPWLSKENSCGCTPESRGRGVPSSRVGRADDRRAGEGLEGSGTTGGPLGNRNAFDPVYAAARREDLREVPASPSDVQRPQGSCAGASFGVATRPWADSSGAHGQPQERPAHGQPPQQSGAGHTSGASQAREAGTSAGQTRPVRPAQPDGAPDDGTGAGDLLPSGGRRTPACARCGVQGSRADDLADRSRGASISWLIAGGESGHRARAVHPDWLRSLRDQSVAADVPFFMKQWGEWGPAPFIVRVCDPKVGWQGTQEELAAAKLDSEQRGATHVHTGNSYDEDGERKYWLHEIGHKPWSLERVGLPEGHEPIRRWGNKHAGRDLDGREWNEFPKAVTR